MWKGLRNRKKAFYLLESHKKKQEITSKTGLKGMSWDWASRQTKGGTSDGEREKEIPLLAITEKEDKEIAQGR